MLVGTVLVLAVVGMPQDSVWSGRPPAGAGRGAQVTAATTTPARGAGQAASAGPGASVPAAPASGPSPFAAAPSLRFAEDANARLPAVWRTPDGRSVAEVDGTLAPRPAGPVSAVATSGEGAEGQASAAPVSAGGRLGLDLSESSSPVGDEGASPWALASAAADVTASARPGESASEAGPWGGWSLADAQPLAADTPVKRERAHAVEYSDWYARRLMLHKAASYTILPLFGLQYYTGTQLMAKGAAAPRWVIKTHGPLATGMLVVFSVNTVTGVWNLIEARKDPSGRFARTLHGVLMLAADAGFMTTGYLAKPAENSGSTRSLHRTIALSSMGAALVSYAIMLPPLRR
jgi:hypothetical protein